MSGYKAQDNELKTRFNTVWANRISVEWPNKTLNPLPQDVNGKPAPWCRFTIIDGNDRTQTTIGGDTNNFRNTGIICIQLFVASDDGISNINQYADDAIAIFNKWGGTNIQCKAGSKKNIGNDGSGYYQVNVYIPFRRDELL